MTREVHYVDVERVVVSGVDAGRLDPAALRALLEHAVAREVRNATLPAGKTMRTAVDVPAPRLGSSSAIATAVASGVKRAIGGGS